MAQSHAQQLLTSKCQARTREEKDTYIHEVILRRSVEDFAGSRGVRRGLKLVRYSDWSRS